MFLFLCCAPRRPSRRAAADGSRYRAVERFRPYRCSLAAALPFVAQRSDAPAPRPQPEVQFSSCPSHSEKKAP
jgi:hypothetical protein